MAWIGPTPVRVEDKLGYRYRPSEQVMSDHRRWMVFAFALLLAACSGTANTQGSCTEGADCGNGPDGLVPVNIDPDGGLDAADGDSMGAEADVPCPDRCAEEHPAPPPCTEAVWDAGTCTCALEPVPDGTPCDDGDSCSVDDACDGGVCRPGVGAETLEPAYGWVEEGTPLARPAEDGYMTPSVLVPTDCRECDGGRGYLRVPMGSEPGFVYVACALTGEELYAGMSMGLLTRYAPDLDVEEFIGLEAPAEQITRMITLENGDLLVGGRFVTTPYGWVARLSPSGEQIWQANLPKAVLGLTEGSEGLYATSGDDWRISVTRLSPDGEEVWQTQAGRSDFPPLFISGMAEVPASDETPASVLIAYDDVTSIALLDGTETQARQPRVGRVTASGELLWDHSIPLAGSEPKAAHAGPATYMGPDRFLVAGMVVLEKAKKWPKDYTAQSPAVVWTIDLDGDVVRRLELPVPWPEGGDVRPRAMEQTPDGGVVVAGNMQQYPKVPGEGQRAPSYGFAVRLDRFGNYLWARRYGGHHHDRFFDVAVHPDGRMDFVGDANKWATEPNNMEQWTVRTDAWGRTCGMRLGECADKVLADCADDNPCTIDWCDPDEGCTHPPLPDDSPCGDDRTCQEGVCQ